MILTQPAEKEPVFEEVPAWRKSLRKTSDNHLGDGPIIPNSSRPREQCRLCVLHIGNTWSTD
jgi:hypothetical protein